MPHVTLDIMCMRVSSHVKKIGVCDSLWLSNYLSCHANTCAPPTLQSNIAPKKIPRDIRFSHRSVTERVRRQKKMAAPKISFFQKLPFSVLSDQLNFHIYIYWFLWCIFYSFSNSTTIVKIGFAIVIIITITIVTIIIGIMIIIIIIIMKNTYEQNTRQGLTIKQRWRGGGR